ncbi:hypothetical protein B0H14DRAFT_2857433 [Mycena olivaceomarginata]|nr:hypothetical protein B0H14DRAFT_2857433 [Mycena olivaceomarginata]
MSSQIMTIFECPQKWAETVEISISLSIPVGARLYVAPVQGSLIPPSPKVAQLARGYAWSTGVPLLSGSQLYGLFTWTRRDLMRARTWSISPAPLTTVFTPDITGLQTIYPANESRPNAATLTLFQQETYATRLLQDTVDTTALTGIATFGGFWTFLNGAFALFFGANVLYFLFGRRPLSALGVVHVFQRHRLVRRWHEDFPAIHTEGGLPGSKSAGIVAFIRERLVDLGEDPHAPTDSDHPDMEAQTSPKGEGLDEEEDVPIPVRSHETQTYSKFTPLKLGYRLEEIPFLDVDLGMDEILDNNKISDRSMG